MAEPLQNEVLQDEVLQEYVNSHGATVRVDEVKGVLEGVKLIGLESRNGRRYRESTLNQAVSLYEEAKVNVNHPKTGALAPRDYQDRLGVIRRVRLRPGEGLFGDLHFNPKHALAEQLIWDAENNPRNVGFSHNVLARLSREGEAVIVEEITRVQSVDLVADPAATQGLFEQNGTGAEAIDEAAPRWDALTLETLQLHRPDLVEEIESMEVERLRQQIDEACKRTATLERRQRVVDLLSEHRLPIPVGEKTAGGDSSVAHQAVSPTFFEMLMNLDDESHLEELVAERAELFRGQSSQGKQAGSGWEPRSRDQLAVLVTPGTDPPCGRDFAQALKS